MNTRRTIATLLASAACALPVTLLAQDTPASAWARAHDSNGASSAATVSWFGAWSPLRPVLDVPRGLLRAPLAPGILEAPPPPTGWRQRWSSRLWGSRSSVMFIQQWITLSSLAVV